MTSPLPRLVVLTAPGLPAPTQLDRLRDRFEVEVVHADGLADAVADADVLMLWDFFSRAVADVWDRCERLRWIHVAAAGVDTLMFDGLRESDVLVTNAHGIFSEPIAEFVLASVMAHAKLMRSSTDLQREHRWQHREPRAVAGSHALVIGTGGIGRATARLLRAVGMRVTGAGRTARTDDPDFGRIVESGRLAEHVGDVDHLVNAAPLTPATERLIDARVLAALPDHAHVVNIGRGPTVVEDDLVAALRSGSIAGASLDVFETEPLPADSPLWDLPGVAVSAHMSGDVLGWRDRLADQFVDFAEAWLAGRPVPNEVDKRLGYVPQQR